MTRAEQDERAELFHELHRRDGVLCLLNAWDAGSARAFEVEGCPALGTTSAGIAFALGRPDGEALSRDDMVEATARIVAAVDVPVTADVESGYGATPDEVGETVAAVIEAGAVGINLEDAAERDARSPLRDVEDQCRRLRAARAAADGLRVRLFINARTDVFWLEVGEEERLALAIERARAYVDAGADGVFVPRLADRDAIERVVAAVPAPLNVLVSPATPPVAVLSRLGVSRLSTGSSPARAGLALARRIARDLRLRGVYDSMLADAMAYDETNDLFR